LGNIVGGKRKGIVYVKASSLRIIVNHKATFTRKSSRVIMRDHSGQCQVQNLENIGMAMKKSDLLILVIGPLS